MTSIEKALAVKHFTTLYTVKALENEQTAEQAKGALDMLLYIEAITPERCAILRAILNTITSKQ